MQYDFWVGENKVNKKVIGTGIGTSQKGKTYTIHSEITGDCKTCHCFPCDHTAKLMGWSEKRELFEKEFETNRKKWWQFWGAK